MRLIDADALMKYCLNQKEKTVDCNDIARFSSAQPMRKKGKWIERECGTEDKAEGWPTVIVCSCCDFPATTFYSEDCERRTQIKTHFCPSCGADMRNN